MSDKVEAKPLFKSVFCQVPDPFSTVEWTERTVVIKDNNGKVVYNNVVEAPASWSDQTIQIVASKYFYGGEKEVFSENSIRQLIHRVARTITDWGMEDGYFTDKAESDSYYNELVWLCLHQYGSFNSPVWFNVGLGQVYGLKGAGLHHFYAWNAKKKMVEKVKDIRTTPQASACFIVSVGDSMEDIMNLSTVEAMIYKWGSGIGVDYSSIRSSKETLSGGGVPSGPLSFMRISDSIGLVVKSGGKTRRSAAMKILRADHPDIFEFIDAKVIEEKKAQALLAAGYSAGMEGEAYTTVSYQNSNFSVRASDAFMEACVKGKDWKTTAVTDGHIIQTIKAKDILKKMAAGVHFCGEPGVQFDDTINRWNTCAASGKINASNPCLVGETKVYVLENGIIVPRRIDSIKSKKIQVVGYDFGAKKPVITPATNLGKTRVNTVVMRLKTSKGDMRLTPDHEVMTARGWIKTQDLQKGDKIYRVRSTEGVCLENMGSTDYPSREDQRVLVSDDIEEIDVLDVEMCEEGEDVYDLNVPKHHAFFTEFGLVSNCSEFMFLDDSACNLASVNLTKFLGSDGSFNTDRYCAAVDLFLLAQDILVDRASYPTKKIAENCHKYRPLGLGYTNLGTAIMVLGLPYDSEGGREFCSAVTSLLTARAYDMSSRIAMRMGAFEKFSINKAEFRKVLKLHRDENTKSMNKKVKRFEKVFQTADAIWKSVGQDGLVFRNAQVSLLAPCGTISFIMGCDTTGIEPDYALVKNKRLANGETIKIVNGSVRAALKGLGYVDKDIEEIFNYLVSEGSKVSKAPGLKSEHFAVFSCSAGDNPIAYTGHLKMMAAAQPFLSGSISKTVNIPKKTTDEEIESIFIDAWKMGLKSVAIFRDGSKTSPLSEGKAKKEESKEKIAPKRYRLDDTCASIRHKFEIAGHEGYLNVGQFEDGSPGELFVKMSKQGSTISGLFDAFSLAISLLLQHGVPLESLVEKFGYMRFEPSGWTPNPDIPVARSSVDYIFRWMAKTFLKDEAKLKSLAAHADSHANGDGNGKTEQELMKMVATKNKDLVKQSGDGQVCRKCGHYPLKKTGTCYTCEECGESGGCG